MVAKVCERYLMLNAIHVSGNELGSNGTTQSVNEKKLVVRNRVSVLGRRKRVVCFCKIKEIRCNIICYIMAIIRWTSLSNNMKTAFLALCRVQIRYVFIFCELKGGANGFTENWSILTDAP